MEILNQSSSYTMLQLQLRWLSLQVYFAQLVMPLLNMEANNQVLQATVKISQLLQIRFIYLVIMINLITIVWKLSRTLATPFFCAVGHSQKGEYMVPPQTLLYSCESSL